MSPQRNLLLKMNQRIGRPQFPGHIREEILIFLNETTGIFTYKGEKDIRSIDILTYTSGTEFMRGTEAKLNSLLNNPLKHHLIILVFGGL